MGGWQFGLVLDPDPHGVSKGGQGTGVINFFRVLNEHKWGKIFWCFSRQMKNSSLFWQTQLNQQSQGVPTVERNQ